MKMLNSLITHNLILTMTGKLTKYLKQVTFTAACVSSCVSNYPQRNTNNREMFAHEK